MEFFLLQDAVTVDCDAVIFSAPFKDFTTPAIPQTIDAYREYRQRAITFIEARNRRIRRYVSADHPRGLREGEESVRREESVRDAVAPEPSGAGAPLTPQAVLELAEQCGTREELARAVEVARTQGLHVRPLKTCLMFAPPANRSRCLFTVWAGREDGRIAAYVSTETFLEFFPLDRADVGQRLGKEGWRSLDKAAFDTLLRNIEALDLSS